MKIYQEGLPAYWGIETYCFSEISSVQRPIRKDYPLTGVLKLFILNRAGAIYTPNQEGLPAYWGIETHLRGVQIAV